MSLECRECEYDVRGGHAPWCRRPARRTPSGPTQLMLTFDDDLPVHPVVAVLRERGLLDRDGRVRGGDFAAVWAELHPTEEERP